MTFQDAVNIMAGKSPGDKSAATETIHAAVEPLCESDTKGLREWLVGEYYDGYETAQELAEDWDSDDDNEDDDEFDDDEDGDDGDGDDDDDDDDDDDEEDKD